MSNLVNCAVCSKNSDSNAAHEAATAFSFGPAEVPELSGCMAHGEDHAEALKSIQEAIELWLDTAKETGRPIPEPKGRKLMYA